MGTMWLRPTPAIVPGRYTRQISSDTSTESQPTQLAAQQSASNSSQLAVNFQAKIPFGTLTFTHSDAGKLLEAPARQIQYALQDTRERLGRSLFSRQDAEDLIQCGLLGGSQWKVSPNTNSIQNLTVYSKEAAKWHGVAGSLTYSLPGLHAFPVLSTSSALQALSALVGIGVLGDPRAQVTEIVGGIVDGVMDGLFGQDHYPDRVYLVGRLTKALLEVEKACGRGSMSRNSFSELINPLIDTLPPALKELAAATPDKIVAYGIRSSQLRTIAEWAFTELDEADSGPWTLVLGNPVEILSAAIVSSCMADDQVRRAVVNCSDETITFLSHTGFSRGMVAFRGGSAQEAIKLLSARNWLDLRIPPKPEPRANTIPELALRCSIDHVADSCIGYLESQGISRTVAGGLGDALKKDAVVQLSRKVSVKVENEPGYGDRNKPENISFHFEFGDINSQVDWAQCLGNIPSDITALAASQPTDARQIGSYIYYGYAAAFLKRNRQCEELHEREMQDLKRKGVHPYQGNSSLSNIIAEVAGLIYAVALSIVMAEGWEELGVRGALGGGFRHTYSQLVVSPRDQRILSRRVVLGVLANLWLGVPSIWADDYPHTALAIGNSRDSVVSAILADTPGLDYATTKFIVSSHVPDILVADEPLILCAGWKLGNVKGGIEIEGICREAGRHDACQELVCLTMSLSRPPNLSSKLSGSVSAMAVVGYISCGSEWYSYVDLDDAFVVMAESGDQKVCDGCPSRPPVHWVDERDFLRRAGGGLFNVAVPKAGQKLVIPAYGSGLKQSFLAGLFRPSGKTVRYQGLACLADADGEIILD